MKTITEFLNSMLGSFGESLPAFVGALLVLFIGIRVAKFVRKLIKKGVDKTSLDSKLAAILKSDSVQLGKLVSTVVYYILVIYVLTIVLSLIGVSDVFEPVKELLGKILGFIPNLIVAGIIIYIGYIVAKLVSGMTSALVGKLGNLLKKIGMDPEKLNVASIVKQIVFLLIFVPILIVGLDALKMEAISNPASAMLNDLMGAIPNIIGAALIILVFLVVGKFVTSVLSELLGNLKVDELPEKMGFKGVLGESKLSKVIGHIVFAVIAIAGIISGLEKLELTSVVEILNTILGLGGNILLGITIIAVGNFLGNLGKKTVGESNAGIAMIVKFAIVGLTFAMGLSVMGIGQDIVSLAFGLTLGAIAVAVALSFGLGGREAAGEQMKKILDKFKK